MSNREKRERERVEGRFVAVDGCTRGRRERESERERARVEGGWMYEWR